MNLIMVSYSSYSETLHYNREFPSPARNRKEPSPPSLVKWASWSTKNITGTPEDSPKCCQNTDLTNPDYGDFHSGVIGHASKLFEGFA